MERTPFDSAAAGLEAVLGAAAKEPPVLAMLRRIDAELRAFAVDLQRVLPVGWHTDGLTLDDYPGPPRQRRLSGFVESREVSFCIELTQGAFYANHEDLGRAPHHFYAEAEVYVDSELPKSGGDVLVMELPIREADSAANAIDALAQSLSTLRSEASRRPPTAGSWRALRGASGRAARSDSKEKP